MDQLTRLSRRRSWQSLLTSASPSTLSHWLNQFRSRSQHRQHHLLKTTRWMMLRTSHRHRRLSLIGSRLQRQQRRLSLISTRMLNSTHRQLHRWKTWITLKTQLMFMRQSRRRLQRWALVHIISHPRRSSSRKLVDSAQRRFALDPLPPSAVTAELAFIKIVVTSSPWAVCLRAQQDLPQSLEVRWESFLITCQA